ncbi:MAG: pro-sigmaK processing inhibitor BofA family protein [Lachnospiraceae bacterium]|jgi:uncharacterized membrane protein (Fun14 family)|nr:pro-sigmaK processing inhibitor BofA family protein [Lachnospiraceae bacterium]
MEMGQGIVWMAGACGIVLLIAGWQKKKEILMNFVLRLVVGVALILVINYGLAQAGVDVAVGLNPFSLMAAGTLGVPGVAMLYGIAGCKFF